MFLATNASAVHDQHALGAQVVDVRAQRRRVEGHQHVGLVRRRADVLRGEVDLEAGDARERAGRGADLGREVREGREVVAGERGGLGELGPGQLHAVAGVPGEADGDPLELLDRLLGSAHGARCSFAAPERGTARGGGDRIVSGGEARRKGRAETRKRRRPMPENAEGVRTCAGRLRVVGTSSARPRTADERACSSSRAREPLELTAQRSPGAPPLAQHPRGGRRPTCPWARPVRPSWSTSEPGHGVQISVGVRSLAVRPGRRSTVFDGSIGASVVNVALDAALSFAESMGFLFDDDMVGDDAASHEKARAALAGVDRRRAPAGLPPSPPASPCSRPVRCRWRRADRPAGAARASHDRATPLGGGADRPSSSRPGRRARRPRVRRAGAEGVALTKFRAQRRARAQRGAAPPQSESAAGAARRRTRAGARSAACVWSSAVGRSRHRTHGVPGCSGC